MLGGLNISHETVQYVVAPGNQPNTIVKKRSWPPCVAQKINLYTVRCTYLFSPEVIDDPFGAPSKKQQQKHFQWALRCSADARSPTADAIL